MEVLFYLNTNYIYIISSHSPHGECGLKSVVVDLAGMSIARHSPHGECGLKCLLFIVRYTWDGGHSPHGECGLKSKDLYKRIDNVLVTPHTGSVD